MMIKGAQYTDASNITLVKLFELSNVNLDYNYSDLEYYYFNVIITF